jgi:hypothetical protein
MAMIIVIPAVALATVLAYAVLANTGMQQQISANAELIAQADCLAESGVNYGIYNLQNPANAPPFTPSTFWTGTGAAIALSGIPGTVNITVSSLGGNNYAVNAVATVPGSNGGTVSRSMTAAVQAAQTFGIPNTAGGFNGNFTPALGAITHITGDLRSNGAVTLPLGSTVSGNVYGTALSLLGVLGQSFIQTPANTLQNAPTSVTDYRTYTYNGVTYSAKLLTTDPAAGTTLGPTLTNPAGIYYTQNRTANLSGVTINGTLIVKSGNLSVTSGNNNVITPMSGFPGLVVDKQITVPGSNKSLTVNGLTWAGTGITGTGSNSGSAISINGSLLIPGTNALNSYTGTVNLNYTAANVNVPNFSSQVTQPTAIKVLSWSQ